MPFKCGDVVWAELDPSSGHEQNKRRPLIVVSNDKFNARCSLTTTVPITTANNGYPLHLDVGLVPGEGGGPAVHGYAEVEQLKSLDLPSRNAVKVGSIGPAGMDKVLSVVMGCLITPEMMVVSGAY